jgi:hypothetical protein
LITLSSINFFTYAEPVTDLSVTVTKDDIDGSPYLNFSYEFTSPENTGLGTPVDYTMTIDANVEGGESTTFRILYSTGNITGTYSIPYSDAYKAGTFTVSVVTLDTNSDNLIMGHPDTVPYIWTDMNLGIDYNVYRSFTDNTIDANISNPMISVTQFNPNKTNYNPVETIVYVRFIEEPFEIGTGPTQEQIGNLPNLDSPNGWTAAYSNYGSLSGYALDATSIKDNECLAIIIIVVSILEYNGNRVIVYSNVRYINYFEFPTAPINGMVKYAAANTELTKMDVNYVFENPTSLGVHANNDAVLSNVSYTVELLNEQSVIIATQTVPFDATNPIYVVNFDDAWFSRLGSVKTYLVTPDTNATGVLDGPSSSASYIATALPQIITPLTLTDDTKLTCEVVTIDTLAPYGSLLCVDADTSGSDYFNFTTHAQITNGITITISEDTVEVEGTNIICYK